jgi:ribosomal protein L31
MATAKKTTARKSTTRSTATVMRCKVSGGFHVQLKGENHPTYIGDGELVRADHKVVKAYPQMFEPADNFDRPEVEAATAAPGEKRG